MMVSNCNFNEDEVLSKVKKFLHIDFKNRKSIGLDEGIKELVCEKLCRTVGINCDYNYRNAYFNFFSSILGEAVMRKLDMPIVLAEDRFRLFKYDHVNLIDKVYAFLDEDIDDAVLDSFNFLDKYTYLIEEN